MHPAIFWGIISLVFIGLGVFELIWSRKKFMPLQYTGRAHRTVGGLSSGTAETRNWVKDFTESLNKHNRHRSYAQAFGYFAASAAALGSFIVSIVDKG